MERQVPAQFKALGPLVASADVVVSGSLEYATPSLCQARGLPRRCALLSPAMVPANAQPMPLLPWRKLPRWMNALSWWLSDVGSGMSIMKLIKKERRALGLGADLPRASIHICGDEVLLPFPECLGQVQGPTPCSVVQMGPWILEDTQPLPPEILAFLDGGGPPMILGLGSMPPTDDFSPTAKAAVESLKRRAIIQVPGNAPRSSDDVMFWSGTLNHDALFARSACVVHHGGAGTFIKATLAQKPQVIIPTVADQHLHGERLPQLGLGPPPLRKGRLNAHTLAATINAALEMSDSDALRRVAQSISTKGVHSAVRHLESVGAVAGKAREFGEESGPGPQ
jgi:vancomycin aglycone glucosyltransferase